MDSKSGSGSSGTFTWGVIAGFVVVIGAGGLYLSGIFGGAQQEVVSTRIETPASEPAKTETAQEAAVQPTDPVESTVPVESQTQITEDQDTTTDEGGDTAALPEETEADAPSGPVSPVLDQIFVETDGNAVLSGNANPGDRISVLLDGSHLHSFTVDDSGQFAEFVSIPFSDGARNLVLESGEGEQTARSDDYLIAALPAPEPQEESVDVAEAPAQTDEGTDTVAVETETTAENTETAEVDGTTQTDGSESAALDTEAAPEDSEETAASGQESEVATAETESSEEEPGQQIAILRSGEDGVELVQPAPSQQADPAQVVLDTIGYSDAGEVELTGRVQEGAAIRLYLDNKLVADLPSGEDGKWRSEIEGIDPGVYTLRVDEIATDGTVVGRLETPFKREPLETLQAAEDLENQDADSSPAVPAIRSVTVQKGDTLWAISRDRFGDGVLYVKLFEANRSAIRDPDLIYPGQIFTIPE